MFLTLRLLVYISFDSPAGIGKPQTNCLGAFNGCPGLKGKTSLGDIQDSAAVVRVEIDIGGSVHCHPWTVASLRPHERYSPCVILGCFSVRSSRGTESGQKSPGRRELDCVEDGGPNLVCRAGSRTNSAFAI